jgi:hypothetical protein
MDNPQRISVVLEFDDEEREWAIVGMLIDSKGTRRRTTLARVQTRDDAGDYLGKLYSNLPIQLGAKP